MARHEKDFRGEPKLPLNLNELLALLEEGMEAGEASREDAIACYLSGGDGWRDAVKMLGGTFADGVAELRERKED